MTHQDMTTTENTQNDANLLILLCAPSHDDLTEYTSRLFASFPHLGGRVELRIFESPLKYEQLLLELSVNPATADVALIFCGHGEPFSLQGPGALPGEPNYRKTFSSFYDEGTIDNRPKLMLAFCCNSAAGIGKAYKLKSYESTFIGFDVDIGFVTRHGIYAEWWRKILHGLASSMLNASDSDVLEKDVQSLYKDAIDFFHRHDRKYRWARAMKWYLLAQLKAIKVFCT